MVEKVIVEYFQEAIAERCQSSPPPVINSRACRFNDDTVNEIGEWRCSERKD